ncbi:GTP-binding protein rhoA, partial [Zopfochytrium polystomum]
MDRDGGDDGVVPVRKAVFVGEDGVGKMHLLTMQRFGCLPEFVSPYFEPYHVDVALTDGDGNGDGKPGPLVSLFVHNHTSAEAANYRLRPLLYPGANVVVVCFSIAAPETLDGVESELIPEVRRYCGNDLPTVLVGCKKDLRDDPATVAELARRGRRPVTSEEGIAVAQRISAFRYVECS